MLNEINKVVKGLAMAALLAVLLLQFIAVLARHAFGLTLPWMQEGAVFAHGAIFMLGAGWTLYHSRHVAIDVVSSKVSAPMQAWLQGFATTLFLMPLAIGIFVFSLPYVLQSWRALEGSSSVGGLPGVFLLKSLLLVFCVLLLVGGLRGALQRDVAQ